MACLCSRSLHSRNQPRYCGVSQEMQALDSGPPTTAPNGKGVSAEQVGEALQVLTQRAAVSILGLAIVISTAACQPDQSYISTAGANSTSSRFRPSRPIRAGLLNSKRPAGGPFRAPKRRYESYPQAKLDASSGIVGPRCIKPRVIGRTGRVLSRPLRNEFGSDSAPI